MRTIILNPKGGSGKTTIATNLAAYYAQQGERPTLMDTDPQGSSARWLRKRPADVAAIHSISAFERSAGVTRSWQLRIPQDCSQVIVDTPAGLDAQQLRDVARGADAILIPVMPSDIDIHAAAQCISDLLLVAKIRRSEGRIGIIANRVRSNTRGFASLLRFLGSLDIPMLAPLRDSQNYVRSAESGRGIHEMPTWQVQKDLEQWRTVTNWLNERARGLASQD
ncbi:MAG: ParA family protein [Gammaproteobacteria bacterium]